MWLSVFYGDRKDKGQTWPTALLASFIKFKKKMFRFFNKLL